MYRKIALMTGIFAVMSFTAHAESSPNILGLTLGAPYVLAMESLVAKGYTPEGPVPCMICRLHIQKSASELDTVEVHFSATPSTVDSIQRVASQTIPGGIPGCMVKANEYKSSMMKSIPALHALPSDSEDGAIQLEALAAGVQLKVSLSCNELGFVYIGTLSRVQADMKF